MLEGVEARLLRIAERRAIARRRLVADRLRAELPPGLAVEERGEAVTLSGRGLGRRFVLEPALRWLLAGLK
jgi:hypothetical protein